MRRPGRHSICFDIGPIRASARGSHGSYKNEKRSSSLYLLGPVSRKFLTQVSLQIGFLTKGDLSQGFLEIGLHKPVSRDT